MTVLAYLVRRGLRLHRGGWVLVAALTALTLTTSVGAIVVADTTLGAHPRLLDSIDAPDLTLGIGFPEDVGQGTPILPEQVAALDGVGRLTVVRNTVGTEVDAQGRFDLGATTGLLVAVDGAPALPLLRGRLPSQDSADEVAISAGAVDALGADVGDAIRYAVLSGDQLQEVESSGADRGGTIVEPVVVGVFGPTELNGSEDDPLDASLILAGGAFLDAHPGIGTYQVASIWLEDGATAEELVRSLEARFGQGVDVSRRTDREADVRRAVQPEAYAMLGFAAAAALAGIVITAQAVSRQLIAGRDELTLLSLGVTRRQRAAERWCQAALAISVGTCIGVVAAVATGRAWGATGVAAGFDVAGAPGPGMLGPIAAAVAVALVLLAAAATSSWRGARVRAAGPVWTSSWRAGLLGSAPLGVRTGVALVSRGSPAARSARAAVVGTATSLAVIVAVITAATSLDALLSTPALYGSDYDLAAWDGYGIVDDDAITEALDRDPGIVGIARTAGSTGAVGDVEADLTGFDDPTIGPRLTEGRLPTSPREVLLGRRLAHRLGAGIGDEVTVAAGQERESFVVVGTGVVPGGQGDGAAFTLEGVRRVAPEAEVGSQLVRLDPTADADSVVSGFVRALGCSGDCDLTAPSPPTDLAYLDRVGSLPRSAVGTMLAVGVAMTIHALVMVGRRSRRALAVLRTLGATSRQVAGYLMAQASLIVLAAAVAGLVAGLVTGRAVWLRVADELGVVPSPRGGAVATALAVGALVLIALAVAAVPSWRAARRPAADALRAEA